MSHSLPVELHGQIAKYVPRRDLTSYMAVSRLTHNEVERELYRCVDLTHNDTSTFDSLLDGMITAPARTAVVHQFLIEFRGTLPSDLVPKLATVLRAMSNLKSLRIDIPRMLLSTILKDCNFQLEHLALWTRWFPPEQDPYLIPFLISQPSLRRLEFPTCYGDPPPPEALPLLSTLVSEKGMANDMLPNRHIQRLWMTSPRARFNSSGPSHLALHVLKLSGSSWELQRPREACPNLRLLELPSQSRLEEVSCICSTRSYTF